MAFRASNSPGGPTLQGYPFRCNIHFLFDDQLRQRVAEINERLSHLGPNQIDLQPRSVFYPHITILMGDIDAPGQLCCVTESVAAFAHVTAPFSFSVCRLSNPDPATGYVFLDICDTEPFIYRKMQLFSLVGTESMRMDEHGGPDVEPHITVGYMRKPGDAVIASHMPIRPATGSVVGVGLAVTGPNGTCSSPIARFSLA